MNLATLSDNKIFNVEHRAASLR